MKKYPKKRVMTASRSSPDRAAYCAPISVKYVHLAAHRIAAARPRKNAARKKVYHNLRCIYINEMDQLFITFMVSSMSL